MAKLAVFDMDRTIVRFGTYTPFLLRYVLRQAPYRLVFAPVVILAMLGYKAKLFTRKRLKEIMFALLVGRVTKARIRITIDGFADKIVKEDCFTEALDAIRRHREAGDTLVLATASFAFYVQPIAEKLGFDHLVATGIHETGERYLPRVDGENCYGVFKRNMVEDLISRENLAGMPMVFYTDDHSDIPTMDLADEGVVVNPTPKLRVHAEQTPGIAIVHWQ